MKFQTLFCGLLSALSFTSMQADVVINELMARNRGAHTNAAGDDRADWIELHNNGSMPVDVTGWHLTDDPFNLTKWTFPSKTIPSGGYLLVYADSAAESVISGELHTNFSLKTEGETLALVAADGSTIVDSIATFEYSPGQFGYPEQSENISYGRNAASGHSFFDLSTPGAINSGGAADFVADTRFSHDRGFYSNAFDLVISSNTPDAEIYYTLNGSDPDTGSTLYTEPIPISQTICVRARAYKAGLYPTNIDTHTYIFVADVVQQSPTGNVPPTPEWPAFDINGQKMQYGMDPDITQDARYVDTVDDALLAIPTISLVTDLDNLFDPASGIYVNANQEGNLWERVTSVELINPDGKKGFQENAGLRIRGGASRSDSNPKHAFRLRFRSEYGASRLEYKMFGEDGADSFNGVDLRCAQTPSFNFHQPAINTHLRDIFSRDMQLACGQPSTRGDHYHLYLNGVYWGMYQTQENVEGAYAEDYFGGNKDDYDIIEKKKHGYSIDGTEDAYAELWGITIDGYTGNANYYKAQGLNPDGVTPNPAYPKLLDLENLMDYMLITYYTGEKDGPASVWATVNNYATLINRENPDGFKHFEYDSEWSLGIGLDNVVGPINKSQWTQLQHFNGHFLHEQLVQNTEYRIAFADRVHKRMFNGGLMTADKAVAMLMNRADEIDTAIIAESARWGDALNDSVPHNKDDHWVPAVNSVVNWLQNRTPTVMSQLRNAGWYPSLDAPVFSQHGGTFSAGFQLSMTGPGTVVYTLDGTDPRQILTGTAQGMVYSGPVPLINGVVVKARSMTSPTNWSALNEAVYVSDIPNTLRISEVMYNPRLPIGAETNNGATRVDFEFIEIQNTGATEIGLAGIELKGHLSNGVSFDFTGGNVTSVPAMGHMLVVNNIAAFAERYDMTGLPIAGEFSGSLDDGGDTIELVTSQGEVLAKFNYGDGRDWPVTADGAGHSLVPLISGSQVDEAMEYGANWRASTYLDGSPGIADPVPVSTVVLNEIEAHTDYNNPTPPFDQYDSNDSIELFNTSAGVISLGDWYLSDDADELKKWAIPSGIQINGASWRSFTEVNDFHSPITSGFGINKAGETVYLSYLPGTADDRVADAVELEGQANGVTLGRLPDGSGYWQATVPTPNATNTQSAVGVVINELMYHPSPTSTHPEDNTNDEYIELCNTSGGTIDLFNDGLTWRLDGGVDFAFPTGTSIAAGQCIAVVSFDPNDALQADEKAAFLATYRQYDGETQLLGPFSGKLSNSSDRVSLEQPQAPDGAGDPPSWIVVDELTYFESSPWPAEADGTGKSIQRETITASGNNPAAWYVPGFASPGFPDVVIELLTPSSGATLFIPILAELTVAIETLRITGSVGQVEFLLDGNSLSVDTTAPYSYTLTINDISTPGSHTLQARVQDDAGLHLSRVLPIQVEFATRVTITNPVDGMGLIPPYSMEVTAEVRNDLVVGEVSQVEFFLDGNSLGVDTSAPYTYTLSQPTTPGTYALTAVMTDSLFSSSSPEINVSVFTTEPIVDLSAVPDHSILLGNGTQLDAVLDLNGLPPETVSVEWSQQSGPGTVNFENPNAPSTAASFSAAGVYVVEMVTHYGTHSFSSTRVITVESGNTLSALRYEESFENYVNGTGLLGFNGWYGDTAPLIKSSTYTLPQNVDQPLSRADHAQALEIEDTVTKKFAGTASYTSLWIDSVCEMTFWRNPTQPETRDTAQLQLYVGDDGLMRVWCTPDPVNQPTTKGWTTLTGMQISDGDFHRLTIHADYQREASGHFYFELYVDGVQVTQPVSRFAGANTDNAFLTQLILSGPFTLDDLVVDERDPFTALYLIQATAGTNGSISPSPNIFVEAGGSQQFAITPDQFFHIADVLVDQSSVGAVSNYQLSNVTTDHEIEAVFAPDLAANDTPHWWLNKYNPAWEADFDAAALSNLDGDSFFTWEEYLSDTDPLDPNSSMWLSISKDSETAHNLQFPASTQRRYTLQRQIGGLDGTWIDIQSQLTGQPDAEGIMTIEQTNSGDDAVFYRIKVGLP
jgi:hypothetical protein